MFGCDTTVSEVTGFTPYNGSIATNTRQNDKTTHCARAVNGAAGEAAEAEEKFTDPIKLTPPQDFHLPECCHTLMRTLARTIYINGDERSKARAVLTQIYHKCIHDDFHSARDMLLMSHLQVRVPRAVCSVVRILLRKEQMHAWVSMACINCYLAWAWGWYQGRLFHCLLRQDT